MAAQQSTFSKVIAATFTSIVAPVVVAAMVGNAKNAESAAHHRTESRMVPIEAPAKLGRPQPLPTSISAERSGRETATAASYVTSR